MCPGRAPACSPRPPLTSPGWTLSPGPGRAAFSVSTLSLPVLGRAVVVVAVEGSVITELSPHRKSRIPFDDMYPFSPCSLFVYALSVLCERVGRGVYLYITGFVFFMNDFTRLTGPSKQCRDLTLTD